MKSKYLFSFSTRPIDESTLFVDVYIGIGHQDQRDREFFERLANNSDNYYFKPYDIDVSNFIRRVDETIQQLTSDPRGRCLHCSMSAAKLRRLIKSGLYDDFARTFYEATRGLHRLALSANSAYHCAIYRANQILANPHNVKNLSQQ